jgi:hypothetical protein
MNCRFCCRLYFDAHILIEKSIEELIVFELLVFCYVAIVDEESTKLLAWWKENA